MGNKKERWEKIFYRNLGIKLRRKEWREKKKLVKSKDVWLTSGHFIYCCHEWEPTSVNQYYWPDAVSWQVKTIERVEHLADFYHCVFNQVKKKMGKRERRKKDKDNASYINGKRWLKLQSADFLDYCLNQ